MACYSSSNYSEVQGGREGGWLVIVATATQRYRERGGGGGGWHIIVAAATQRYREGRACYSWHVVVAAAAICWMPLEFIFRISCEIFQRKPFYIFLL